MAEDRRLLVSGNWKMHHNHFEAIQAVQKLAYRLTAQDYATLDVSLHPPFTDIRSVQTVLDADDIPIALGAQDCHWEDRGAFTGEVSPAMLAKLSVSYVIVGHSERREIFHEPDEMVALKLRAVLRNNMTPILCVGETLEERQRGDTAEKIERQLDAALGGLGGATVGKMVVAYEPIWAIGTGYNASSEDAQDVCKAVVRSKVAELSGPSAAETVRVQYGGSVKPDNAEDLVSQPDVDGLLVGGASLDPDTFGQIVHATTSSATT